MKTDNYIIREANKKDIPFLTHVIMWSEMGRSDRLSYATLFNISHEKVESLISKILEEEVDGCELSLSSFLVVENKSIPIAAFGAWIESYNGNSSSSFLKSNLLLSTFEKASIEFFKSKSDIIKDILIEREPMTLQFEYLFVSEEYLGKKLDYALLEALEKRALSVYPDLKKAQNQLFKNSIFTLKLFSENGFDVVASYKSNNENIFDYVPFDEKLLMEKIYKS